MKHSGHVFSIPNQNRFVKAILFTQLLDFFYGRVFWSDLADNITWGQINYKIYQERNTDNNGNQHEETLDHIAVHIQ